MEFRKSTFLPSESSFQMMQIAKGQALLVWRIRMLELRAQKGDAELSALRNDNKMDLEGKVNFFHDRIKRKCIQKMIFRKMQYGFSTWVRHVWEDKRNKQILKRIQFRLKSDFSDSK